VARVRISFTPTFMAGLASIELAQALAPTIAWMVVRMTTH
jgi:hypothetical protein